MEERIKAWITSHALTRGIIDVDAVVVRDDESSRMISYRRGSAYTVYVYGKDWHRTREAAVKRAEEMRLAKIKSLRRQIEKLEKLRFE